MPNAPWSYSDAVYSALLKAMASVKVTPGQLRDLSFDTSSFATAIKRCIPESEYRYCFILLRSKIYDQIRNVVQSPKNKDVLKLFVPYQYTLHRRKLQKLLPESVREFVRQNGLDKLAENPWQTVIPPYPINDPEDGRYIAVEEFEEVSQEAEVVSLGEDSQPGLASTLASIAVASHELSNEDSGSESEDLTVVFKRGCIVVEPLCSFTEIRNSLIFLKTVFDDIGESHWVLDLKLNEWATELFQKEFSSIVPLVLASWKGHDDTLEHGTLEQYKGIAGMLAVMEDAKAILFSSKLIARLVELKKELSETP